MAGYNLVRTRAWDLRERHPGAVVCDTYSQRWDVILPAGDVIVTEVIRGLRGDGGQVDEMVVYTEAAGLTKVDFSAKYLVPERRDIPHERFVENAPDARVPRIGYRLKFDPALQEGDADRVDVLFPLPEGRFGGFASSREDQAYAGVPAQRIGKEEFHHEVLRACGRLVINVRFFSDAAGSVPDRLDLRVYDPNSRPAPYEAASDHITWDFWSSGRESRSVYELPSVPEANMSVCRAADRLRIRGRWDLPGFEPFRERDSLLSQRTRLLHLEDDPEALRATIDFLGGLKTFLRQGLSDPMPLVRWDDPSLGVYLFAFDDHSAEMVRKRQDSFHADPFPRRVAWTRLHRHGLSLLVSAVIRSPRNLERPLPCSIKCSGPVNDPGNYAWPLWRAEWTGRVDGDQTFPEPIDIALVTSWAWSRVSLTAA